ncbi:hypothetical protein AU375_02433 [Methylobacterium radiotolerans]|nr:hypothetical protein AU375_02433 [Methylobacterium radiotolerans]
MAGPAASSTIAAGTTSRRRTGRAGSATVTGMRAEKVEPAPTRLVTATVPPMAATICWAIESPRPVPPNRRVVDWSACEKAEKIVASLSCGMPIPVSETAMTRQPSPASIAIRTETWPASVNFSAFDTKLLSTCPRRTGSPRIARGTSGATSAARSSPAVRARSAKSVTAVSASSAGLTGTRSSSSLPASTFAKSRMSLMIASSDRPDRAITSA